MRKVLYSLAILFVAFGLGCEQQKASSLDNGNASGSAADKADKNANRPDATRPAADDNSAVNSETTPSTGNSTAHGRASHRQPEKEHRKAQ